MGATELPSVPDKEYRAILTEREREILTGEDDVSESYYYRVITRVRDKIERVEEDLEVLDEHHDTLGDELRDVVCPGYSGGYAELGEGLEWDRLRPVGPHSVDRLEYVIETLEGADQLPEGLSWSTEIVEGKLTIEEVLGALGEAKWLLESSREDDGEP